MKNAKNISFMILTMLAFPHIYGAQESTSDRMVYQQETNDKFIYDKDIIKSPLNGQMIDDSVEIKISKHYFDAGITRTKTQIQVIGDEIVKTIEVWVTNNPSRITATNLALGAAAAAGVGALGYINREKIKSANDSMFGELSERYSQAAQGLGELSDQAKESISNRYSQFKNYLAKSQAEQADAMQNDQAAEEQPAAIEEVIVSDESATA